MAEDRDSGGRFVAGNGGGPGRPPRQVERAYIDTMLGAVSLGDWAAIVQRAVNDAKNGDAQARAWLGKYVLGDGKVLDRIESMERQAAFDTIYGDPLLAGALATVRGKKGRGYGLE